MKFLFCCFLILLSGCRSSQTDRAALQDFSRNEATQTYTHTLGSTDVIEFSVEVNGLSQVPETRVELNEDGTGTFPLIGDVELAGLTRAQAKTKVQAAYRKLYVNPPMISFAIVYDDQANAWGYVTVLGRVQEPGRVAINTPEGIYLSEALKLAGGFSLGAKRDGIKVSRLSDQGQTQQIIIDFKRIADSGDIESNLRLRAGDMVYVPERLF